VALRITDKRVKQNVYYYAVNSHPKPASPAREIYLGSAEDVVTMVEGFRNPPPPVVTDREFGPIAALLSIANRLELTKILDEIFPKRNSGPSVGTYLLVGAISRCLQPISKRATPNWYEQTILPRILGYDSRSFTSQRFWDNCHHITEDELIAAQLALARQAMDKFYLNTQNLLYDSTNYDTYLNTKTSSAVAQRGHAKSKRNDLRIVGVAVLATEDGNVPLFHGVYPGNRPDSKEFSAIFPDLKRVAAKLSFQEPSVTIILDKGNNSKKNWELWADSPYHFVGSLSVSDYPDLLEIPLGMYEDLAQEDGSLSGCRAFRETRKVFGQEYEVVVSFNQKLYDGQMQGIEHNIARCQHEFNQIAERLRRWRQGEITKGRKPTVQGILKQANTIRRRQFMAKLWQVKVVEKDGFPEMTVTFDTGEFSYLRNTLLGKTIIFTSKNYWSNAQIVKSYRLQWHIEQMFRWSKDRRHNSWEPVFHWTDRMIRVHTFCCMLGLTLTALLLRELNLNGFQLSQCSMFDHLEGIRETEILHPAVGRFPAFAQTVLHQMSGVQQGLFKQLELQNYCSPPISSSRCAK